MNDHETGESLAVKKKTLKLSVRYAPAKHPYKDANADPSLTLAEVKSTVLSHFELSEGSLEGGTKTYQLSYEDIVQTNLSITLGSLGEHMKEVELLLIEQFVQG